MQRNLAIATVLVLACSLNVQASDLKIETDSATFEVIPALGIADPKTNKNFPAIAGAVSPDGHIIVGGTGEAGDVAFKWSSKSGTITLGDLPGGEIQSWAEGVSRDGQFIVGSSSVEAGKTEAVLWSDKTGAAGLGFLDGGHVSTASAITPDGMYVVGKSETTRGGTLHSEPFLWSRERGMISLGLPAGASDGEAFAITEDGRFVGGEVGGVPFIWSPNKGFTLFPNQSKKSPPEDGTAGMNVVCALSKDASVAGGGLITDKAYPKAEAFVWDAKKGIRILGDLEGGGDDSIVYSLSADGNTAVGQATTSEGQEAFIWRDDFGMRRFQDFAESKLGVKLSGWRLNYVISVTPDGKTFVGIGENGGNKKTWILTTKD